MIFFTYMWYGIAIPIYIIICLTQILKYIHDYTKVKKHNKLEQERLSSKVPIVNKKKALLKEVENTGISKEQHLKSELEKVNTILQKAYSQNILANSYRNLASVYYIYDYMSSSMASLKDTLLHEHMENGIQRITSRLDIIIEQNEELIFSLRQVECNTRKSVEQTTLMLNTLQKSLATQQRTEQNTSEAAHYAQIAATYSQTNAFFSMASYLRK